MPFQVIIPIAEAVAAMFKIVLVSELFLDAYELGGEKGKINSRT